MKPFATILLIATVAPYFPAQAAGVKAGAVLRDGADAPVTVIVPGGTALLGSTEAETTREGRTPAFALFEHPQRAVRFERPFAVGRYPVTRGEYARFVRATGRQVAGCVVLDGGKWSDGPEPQRSYMDAGFPQRADEPAVCVSWEDANAYAAWISARTGHRYRLPTEDEWEYAARAGTRTARWWGDDATGLCTRANGGDRDYAAAMPADKSANLSCSDGFAYTSPVARFAPNAFGLFDMYGNAWQWTADCFSAVRGADTVARAGSEPCAARAIRGGSWHSSASTLRSATRFSLPPSMRSSSLGFRVMRELERR